MAETALQKVVTLDNLAYVIEKLYARAFNGLGLSQENFTTTLKSKLETLASSSTAADLTKLAERVTAVEKLIESDTNGAIDKFNEIVAFLDGISDASTLDGLLSGINTSIADAKKAGTDAATALNTYKGTNDAAVKAVADKVNNASTGLDSKATKASVTALQGTVETLENTVADKAAKADLTALQTTVSGKASQADLTALQNTVAGKLDASAVQAVTSAEIDSLLAGN